MKTLRQTCTTTILTLVLAVSVLAGEIDCPGVVSPTQPPAPTSTTTTNITTTIIVTILGLLP